MNTLSNMWGSCGLYCVLCLQPVPGTDTVIKSGLTQNVSTKLQCITAMKQYEDKSLEV